MGQKVNFLHRQIIAAVEIHAALVDDVIEVAQAAGVFPPGGKAAEIFGVKAIDDEPLLRGPADSYRRMARYYTKESTDGIIIPTGSRPWTSRTGYRLSAMSSTS